MLWGLTGAPGPGTSAQVFLTVSLIVGSFPSSLMPLVFSLPFRVLIFISVQAVGL